MIANDDAGAKSCTYLVRAHRVEVHDAQGGDQIIGRALEGMQVLEGGNICPGRVVVPMELQTKGGIEQNPCEQLGFSRR